MPPPPPGRQEASPGDQRAPPTPPPPLPHRPECGRRGGPPTDPPPHPPQLGSHRRGPPPPQGRGGAPPPRRDGDAVSRTAAGPAPANPHRRAGATRITEQEGGRAPHDPPVTTAHSGMTEGGFRSAGAPGGAVHGPPLTPPTPGRHFSPDRTRTPEGNAPATRRGPGWSTAGRRPEGEQGGRGATPPPPPPTHRPASRGGPGPHPPGQGGWSPPAREGSRSATRPPPQPPAPMGTAENKRAHACAPGRRTDRTQRRRVSTNRSGMGGHAPHRQHNASDARFVACPGKAEGQNEAERPPALQAPPQPHNRGVQRTPPPPQPAPQHMNATDPPRGAQPPRGQSRAPTPARPRPQHVDRGPRQPAQWTGSRGRGGA